MEDQYEVPVITQDLEIEFPIYEKKGAEYVMENGVRKIIWEKGTVVLKELDFETLNKVRAISISTKIVGTQILLNPDMSKIQSEVLKEALVSAPFPVSVIGKMPSKTTKPILDKIEEMNFIDDKKKVESNTPSGQT